MSCSLNKIKSDSYKKMNEVFKTTDTIKVEGKVVTITPDPTSKKVRNMNQAILIAKRGAREIEKWASETFGKAFSTGWTNVFINTNKVNVELSFPKNLEVAYQKKLGVEEKIEQEQTSTGTFIVNGEVINAADYEDWIKSNEEDLVDDEELYEYYTRCKG